MVSNSFLNKISTVVIISAPVKHIVLSIELKLFINERQVVNYRKKLSAETRFTKNELCEGIGNSAIISKVVFLQQDKKAKADLILSIQLSEFD